MTISISGGCLCGKLRYKGEGEAIFSGHCHCSDCRKYTGAGHLSGMAFPTAALTVTGTPKSYSKKADSGNTVTRMFCPDCGSSVMAKNTGMDGVTIIAAGTLDDPNVFTPQMAVYASRAAKWDQPAAGLPTFPEMPPMG